MKIEENDILDVLKKRIESRAKEREATRLSNDRDPTANFIGNMLLGVGSGLAEGLTGRSNKALEIYNRKDDARLKALEKDDGMKELLDLYKIRQTGDLQRGLQEMRNEAARSREAAQDARFKTQQAGLDRRFKAQQDALDKRQKNQFAQQEKQEISKGIKAAGKELTKNKYKFASDAVSTASTRRVFDNLLKMYDESKFTGPVGDLAAKITMAHRWDPKYSTLNKTIEDAVSELVKERSGVAASDRERAVLKSTLPNINETREVFSAGLDRVLKKVDAIIEDRRKAQEEFSEDTITTAIPDPELRRQAIEAIRAGKNPVDVLNYAKELMKGGK